MTVTAHVGPASTPACPVCAPLIVAAQTAQRAWETEQARVGGRSTVRYRVAAASARAARRELLAAKGEHYREVAPA